MKLLLTFSGAEKEAKRHPPPPSRPLYWAGVTQEIAETVDFLPCRKAGTRLELFIGWRIEETLRIYTMFLRLASSNKRQSRAKTPRGLGCETPKGLFQERLFSDKLYHPKRSACVPVWRKRSVSSLSFCSQVMSQFGSIWHSHCPLWSPFNGCGLYSAGSVPVASRRSIASVINFMFRPRFIQRLKSFLNRVEILTVYAISESHFFIEILQ